MPLYSKKQINNGIVALWDIKESKDELLEMVPSNWLRNLAINKLSRHNLAARVLANTVCPDFDILEKDKYGKPYFESSEHKISITHAGNFAAFQFKEKEDCGIDMEQITNRIERIVPKFMREDEKEYLKHNYNGMYAVWCAKEALYKYYGLKSLDFRDHLKLEYKPLKDSGILKGYIKKEEYYKELELSYEFFDEYLLIHTI
ncbi:MAG: 4'-phosphopantetheinyl transferase superfamily protein [Bacteroidia bacterium]|nr:4'-phosphopantetheinyl transferase superfamily protein [Bacteroidia bacterium]NNJ54671.1 4'-phosphopantetheinyl transferase superfamily protein [Bacteroidia bacterium]